MEIDSLYAADDSCQMQLSSRGHHDIELFKKACEKFLREWDERECELDTSKVSQTYWTTRKPEDHETLVDEGDFVYTESNKENGFPVTIYTDWLPIHA